MRARLPILDRTGIASPSQPESRLQAVSNKAGGTGSSRNRELGRVGSQAELNRKHMGGKNWTQLGPLWGLVVSQICEWGSQGKIVRS